MTGWKAKMTLLTLTTMNQLHERTSLIFAPVEKFGIDRIGPGPVLYEGPFPAEILTQSGNIRQLNIRDGQHVKNGLGRHGPVLGFWRFHFYEVKQCLPGVLCPLLLEVLNVCPGPFLIFFQLVFFQISVS